MKIVYCSISKIPSREANSIHIMKMCQAFSDLGHDTVLLSSDVTREDAVDVYSYYNVRKNFAIRYAHWPRRFRLQALRYAYSALRIYKEEKAALVYSRDVTCCLVAAVAGYDTVWESHSAIDGLGTAALQQFKVLLRMNKLKKIVVISEQLKKYYMDKHNVDARMIHVAHDGADPVDPAVKAFEGICREEMLNVGYIGHLYKGKGMEILSQLAPKCPDTFFHIVGGMEKDIAFWKEELNGCNNVKFYGFVKPVEAQQYGMAMDCLIAPYLRSVGSAGATSGKNDIGKWMSPLKLFEYMSWGKPIICSDLEVLQEVMTHNVNCLMCDPDNIDAWTKAIDTLKDDVQLRNEIGQRAREDFTEKYTWKKRAEGILHSLR